jgi:hypothetical protein
VSNAERIVSVTACEAGISKAVEAPQWHDSAEFSCANRNDDRRCGRGANSASVVATEFVETHVNGPATTSWLSIRLPDQDLEEKQQ